MPKFYAGIGSRGTPYEILNKMGVLASDLSCRGYILRSGHADGADQAFEMGANPALTEIFLPWNSYNNDSGLKNLNLICELSEKHFELAEKYHPAWMRCSQGAKKLHARNGQIILGKDLTSPVDFVVCWHEGTGGTMQAVRIAKDMNIPVINMLEEDWENQLQKVLEKDNV